MGRPHAKTAKPVTQVGPSDSQKVRHAAHPLRFLTETSQKNNSGPGYRKRSVRKRFDISCARGLFGEARSCMPHMRMVPGLCPSALSLHTLAPTSAGPLTGWRMLLASVELGRLWRLSSRASRPGISAVARHVGAATVLPLPLRVKSFHAVWVRQQSRSANRCTSSPNLKRHSTLSAYI